MKNKEWCVEIQKVLKQKEQITGFEHKNKTKNNKMIKQIKYGVIARYEV